MRVNLDDPIAPLAVLAVALLGLATVWLAERRLGRSKWLGRLTLMLALIIAVALVLLGVTYDSTSWLEALNF